METETEPAKRETPPETERKGRIEGILRLIAPALYGALILAGGFKSDTARIFALGFLIAFTIYTAVRIWSIVARQPEGGAKRGLGGIDGVELGLLTVLVFATMHQSLPMLDIAWPATHAVMIALLAFAIPIPELFMLPLIGALLQGGARGGHFTIELALGLGFVETLALVVGLGVALKRRKINQLQNAVVRVKLEAEHLSAMPEEDTHGERHGELERLDHMLYNHLNEVKENTGAHTAVLALKTGRGNLFIRQIATDSHSINDQAGLDLRGNAFGHILKTKEPLRIPRIQDASVSLGYYNGKVAVRSFVGVPMISDGEVVGIVSLDSMRDDSFNDDKLGVLKVSVHQLANTLAEMRNVQRAEREARDFKSLHEFAKQVSACANHVELMNLLLHILGERLKPEFSAVAVLIGETEARVEAVGDQKYKPLDGKVFTVNDGLVGWALDSGQYLYYENAQGMLRRPIFSEKLKIPDYASLLIHPFGSSEEPLGALIAGFSIPKALDLGALAFCDILCQQVALGLLQIRALEKLKEMATTDGLTGLKNRRIFFEVAHDAARRAKRYHNPLSIILIDLDFFKRINDTYGHAGGDEVLKRTAELLEGHAREVDLAARIGGEEFALLLPSTDEKGAYLVAERLRLAASGLRVKWDDLPIKITISVGVTQLDGQQTVEQMMEHADQALYRAKQNGRNRVERFSLMPRGGDLPLG